MIVFFDKGVVLGTFGAESFHLIVKTPDDDVS